ncbi:MAG: hypothetical protein V3V49_05540 [Candidatus Krumholzibacteria bacterium]
MSIRRGGAFHIIKRALILTRNVWIIGGLVLVLLAIIELASGIIVNTKQKLTTPAIDSRVNADSYRGATWTEDYYGEFGEITLRWKPYVHYQRKPFQGEYITVDEQGHRGTVYPRLRDSQSTPLRVFMFGASTMWGTGARDEYTVASLVGKILSEKGVAADVTNFAESGYVSTQEVIALLLELRGGNIPDVVVFYDGIGDAFAAFQSGVAGRPMNEYRRIREFNLLHESRTRDLTKMYILSHLERSNTVRLLQAIVRRLRPDAEFRGRLTDSGREAGDSATVEEDVVDTWIANMRIVKRLGEAYGFTPILYWQPVIFTKDELSEYEQKELEKKQSMEAFFLKTYAYMKRSHERLAGQHFHDISDIFKDAKEPYYIDFAHVSESANEVLGRRMAADILETTGK